MIGGICILWGHLGRCDMIRPVPKVAAVHDISGYGRASLSVVLPVMAALGVQVCPLPTALLSTQTSGFTGYHYRDLTDDMKRTMNHWNEIGLRFDGIYSGFLGSSRQIACVIDLISNFADDAALVVVDPVLGDEGESYGPITDELVAGMRELIGHADVIVPNHTEASLLLGEPYRSDITEDQVIRRMKRLSDVGPSLVVITSVPIASRRESSFVYMYDRIEETAYRLEAPLLPAAYPGSGDMFASIMTASLMQRLPSDRAVARAAEYVALAIQEALDDQVPIREGLLIEPVLARLAGGEITFSCTEVREG